MNPRDQAVEWAVDVLVSHGWVKSAEYRGYYPFACGKKGARLDATIQCKDSHWRVTISIGARELSVKTGSSLDGLLPQAEIEANAVLIEDASLLNT